MLGFPGTGAGMQRSMVVKLKKLSNTIKDIVFILCLRGLQSRAFGMTAVVLQFPHCCELGVHKKSVCGSFCEASRRGRAVASLPLPVDTSVTIDDPRFYGSSIL